MVTDPFTLIGGWYLKIAHRKWLAAGIERSYLNFIAT